MLVALHKHVGGRRAPRPMLAQSSKHATQVIGHAGHPAGTCSKSIRTGCAELVAQMAPRLRATDQTKRRTLIVSLLSIRSFLFELRPAMPSGRSPSEQYAAGFDAGGTCFVVIGAGCAGRRS